MRELNLNRFRFSWLLMGFMNGALSCAMAAPSGATVAQQLLGNDEDTFVFMARCPSGAMYRLISYDKEVGGIKQSFYDYEGPAGKGTVKTKTAPRVMASRVCLDRAEIAGDE
jgi:hypothetical protein